ncbi:DinB family protein [Micromonospora sp. H33]|uniref:DinB family protein n=1 Tax=Micromonospora sp. H33 TaxID=3452215 RepID=UPI003F895132
MTLPFPSPTVPAADRREVFVRYLDYFRESLIAKVEALPEPELRRSRVASGWTPLELVKHLRYVERRWIEWGFQGRAVDEPWGDWRDDRWHVRPEENRDDLVGALREQGAHTRAVIEAADLDAVGAPGPRWAGAQPATLERVLFHLVQEYARHLGHLDIVAELAGGPVGE